jgi:uncharacterized membrane protein YhiD involved in acid resistance
MAAHDATIADVFRDAIRDAQDLVRSEIALAKAEAREEVRRLGAGAALLAAATIAAVAGALFMLTAAALGLAAGFGWPAWAGFAVVAVLLIVAAAALAYTGRARLSRDRHMPLTIDTFKESMRWMRARTS